jgi:hypothetical protein
MVDKKTLEQVFRVLLFYPANHNSTLLHTHLSPPHEVCDSPEQAAHYHIRGPKLGASSLTRHLAGLGAKVVSFVGKTYAFEI